MCDSEGPKCSCRLYDDPTARCPREWVIVESPDPGLDEAAHDIISSHRLDVGWFQIRWKF